MAELNSKELLQNIKDAIAKPMPKLGQHYILMPDHYRVVNAAIIVATGNERARIIKILNSELTGNPLMLEEIIFLINDRNVL